MLKTFHFITTVRFKSDFLEQIVHMQPRVCSVLRSEFVFFNKHSQEMHAQFLTVWRGIIEQRKSKTQEKPLNWWMVALEFKVTDSCHSPSSKSFVFSVDGSRDCHTEWRKSEREKQISYIYAYIWNLEKWYRWTDLQVRNRDTDVEDKRMDTKGGNWRGGGGMNWETGFDIYTLICIKWITNKNLL